MNLGPFDRRILFLVLFLGAFLGQTAHVVLLEKEIAMQERLGRAMEQAILVAAENGWARGVLYEQLTVLSQDASSYTKDATTNFIATFFHLKP